jgi:DNA topoisomerase 2-associated protein PAT1
MAEEAKRAKRNHKIFLLSKGNGLMTPQDKNFITRIQLQQLVAATGNTTDPDPEAVLSEDFYYQVYSQIRGAPRQHPRQPLGHFAQTYLFQTGRSVGSHGSRRQFQSADNHMQRMQQQVQRAVEAAKLKPKNKQLIIEGSLGKISFSNAKTPKPMLNIKRPESSDGIKSTKRIANTELSPSDRKSILTNIESVYGTLMKMEDMERTMSSAPEEHDLDALQRHLEWRQRMQSLNQKLWYELKVLEPIVPGSTIPHPFIALLSYPKGKKAIPRIFRQIDQEQRVTILTIIVVHLDALDVVRRGQLQSGENQPPVAVREEIELFSQTVMPSLLGYVNEAPFNIIIGLLGLVLAQTHVQSVARTKVGLGILTMLLSRAEIVKDAEQADERDWLQWCEKFDILFDSLEPILGNIFPSSINSGDDIYAWQFLAAVGIGANPEQQQRLVIAVKDRVMETVAQSKTLPADMASQRLGNVNLFMRAIGLDVDLLY